MSSAVSGPVLGGTSRTSLLLRPEAMSTTAGSQFRQDGNSLAALRVTQLEPQHGSDRVDVLPTIGAVLMPWAFGVPAGNEFEVRPVDRPQSAHGRLETLQRLARDLGDRDTRVRGPVREAEGTFPIEESGGPRQLFAVRRPAFTIHTTLMMTPPSDTLLARPLATRRSSDGTHTGAVGAGSRRPRGLACTRSTCRSRPG
jgi:hypothetical protein